MKNFFNLIDFCSAGVQLRLNGNTRHTSNLGGFVSLLVLLAVLFLIFYLGLDIVLKEKPRLIISEVEQNEPTQYNLTSKDFMFGFKIVDSFNEVVKYENFIDVIIMNSIGVKNADVSEGQSPFNKTDTVYSVFDSCDNIQDYKELNLSTTLKTFKCPKNFSMLFGGDFSDDKYATLDFLVRPCRGKPTCKTQEELKTFVDRGLFLVIYYRDNLIDPKKADSPIQITHSPLLIGLSDLLQLDLYFYYKNLEVKSDFGFLFEDLKYTNTYKYDSKETVYRSRGSKYFLWGTMYLTKKSTTFERRYLKVQEIAANIGGLFKFLWIAGIIFMYPVSTKSINVDLMNEMFHFQPYGTDISFQRQISSSSFYKKSKELKDEVIVKNYSTNQHNISEEPYFRNPNNPEDTNNAGINLKEMSKKLKLNKNKDSKGSVNDNGENKLDVIPFVSSINNPSNPNQSSLNYISSQNNIISEQDINNNKLNLLNNKDNYGGLLIGTSKDDMIKQEKKNKNNKKDQIIKTEIYGKEGIGTDKGK